MYTVGNLWISEARKILMGFGSPKYKIQLCSIICESIVLVIYFCLKIYFPIHHLCKTWIRIEWYAQTLSEFTELLARCVSIFLFVCRSLCLSLLYRKWKPWHHRCIDSRFVDINSILKSLMCITQYLEWQFDDTSTFYYLQSDKASLQNNAN